MTKVKKPLFSDDFLDELAEEISDLYGGPDRSQKGKEDSLNEEKNCRISNSFSSCFLILQQE